MSERTDELLDEVVRLLALSLRRGMDTQTEAQRLRGCWAQRSTHC